MSPRPVPDDLLPWAIACLGDRAAAAEPVLSVVAGDASNRRYFRLTLPAASYIVVEAPPATENNTAFLSVRDLLAGAGVRVPALYGADLGRGYLLLEDLGDRLLLPELRTDTVEGQYRQACSILRQLAGLDTPEVDLPAYDDVLLAEELGRFPTWFVTGLLARPLDDSEQQLVDGLFRVLIDSALEQPRVLVHRDFHSRNLMPQPTGGLAVIDFQDAVVGPVTYDLVSLLRDCYIRWPASQVRNWALSHRDDLVGEGLLREVDDAHFLRWFDWMGLQRHLKVLGTFARLHLRDGKPGYLDDLPQVLDYVREVVQAYAREHRVFADFGDWFDDELGPLVAAQPWSAAS